MAYALGTVHHAGMSEEEAWALVRHTAATHGLSEVETRATFRSGWSAGVRSPAHIYAADHVRPPRRRELPSIGDYSVDVPDDQRELLHAMWVQVQRLGGHSLLGDWCRPRGIDPQCVIEAGGGHLSQDAARAMRALCSVHKEAAAACGLWNEEKDRPWFPLAGIIACFLVPVWHPTYPWPVSYRARIYRPQEGRQKAMATRTKARWAQWPMGCRGLREHLVIAEGEPDWLALRTCGIDAIGTTGSLWLPHWRQLLRGVRRITIAAQHGPAAERLTAGIIAAYADLVGSEATSQRVSVVVTDDESMDWDDALAQMGRGWVCQRVQ